MKDAEGKVIEERPFIFAVMTPFQLAHALKYSHNGPLIIDSTFGTNNLGVRTWIPCRRRWLSSYLS